MTLVDLKDAILGNLGTLVTLVLIIYAGYKKWWVFGWYAAELKSRNERLENRIDSLSGTSRDVISLAEKATKIAEQAPKPEVTS